MLFIILNNNHVVHHTFTILLYNMKQAHMRSLKKLQKGKRKKKKGTSDALHCPLSCILFTCLYSTFFTHASLTLLL